MKSVQFDHEESENRGPKVPWFILKDTKSKYPKLGKNLKFIISQFPLRYNNKNNINEKLQFKNKM